MRLTQIRAVRRGLVPLLAVGLLVSGLARMANADTITVTGTIPSGGTDDTVASLPFFESAPGFVAGDVLTGVQIEIDATETISKLDITNNSKKSKTFTFTATGEIDPAGAAPGFSPPLISLPTYSALFTLAGGATVSPIPPPVSTDLTSGLVSVAFSPYDTTGMFDLGFTTANTSKITGTGGKFTVGLVVDTIGTVEAIYTFTPPIGKVPEPGTIFLLGSGLLFAGSLLRKRYSRG